MTIYRYFTDNELVWEKVASISDVLHFQFTGKGKDLIISQLIEERIIKLPIAKLKSWQEEFHAVSDDEDDVLKSDSGGEIFA